MARPSKDPTPLQDLVLLAVPLCRQAQAQLPRCGPGRPAVVPDWLLST